MNFNLEGHNIQPILVQGVWAKPQEKGVCRGSQKAAEARGKAFPHKKQFRMDLLKK